MKFSPRFNPRNCLRKALLLPSTSALIVLGLTVQTAWAHHPHVASAIPACVDGVPGVSYTITSWDPGNPNGDGDNPDVAVLFNGVIVPGKDGAFIFPVDSFSGMAEAPMDVTMVVVTAEALGTWGDAYPPPEFSDNAITVDLTTLTNCAPAGNGRFTGGGKVVVSNAIVPTSGSVTVTKGFEVECDLDPKHENLELNWAPPTGSNFHMDTITSANCTLQGPPEPPFAMVNRIDATGTGKYNGMDGYTVVFTLIDNGEPGTNDAAGFVVCLTDMVHPNTCSNPATQVLNVPLQTVSTGNIQAHLDQGH